MNDLYIDTGIIYFRLTLLLWVLGAEGLAEAFVALACVASPMGGPLAEGGGGWANNQSGNRVWCIALR
jgi:hypothetical protein